MRQRDPKEESAMNDRVEAAEKIADLQTEGSLLARPNRADREAFRLILNCQGGEPPTPGDSWDNQDSA
jgi:hypothetical protein